MIHSLTIALAVLISKATHGVALEDTLLPPSSPNLKRYEANDEATSSHSPFDSNRISTISEKHHRKRQQSNSRELSYEPVARYQPFTQVTDQVRIRT